RFSLRAHGKPGHASVPQRDSSVLKLARGLDALGNATLPVHITETARNYVEGLAKAVGGSAAHSLRAVLDTKNNKRAFDNLAVDEGLRGMIYAMLHNTA